MFIVHVLKYFLKHSLESVRRFGVSCETTIMIDCSWKGDGVLPV